MNKLMTVGVCATVAAALAFTGSAATYYAKPDGADDAACTEQDPGSISSAIAKASEKSGNTVLLTDGDYDVSKVTSTQSGYTFKLSNNVTLRSMSGNRETCRIVGGGDNNKRAAFYSTGSTLKDLTVTNFSATVQGCGIYANGTTVITNCHFTHIKTSTSAGFAYQNYGNKLTVYNSFVESCTSDSSYSICYAHGGTTAMYDTEFFDCHVQGSNAGTGVFDGRYTRCIFRNLSTEGTGVNSSGAVEDSAALDHCLISNCWTRTNTSSTPHGVFNKGTVNDCVIMDCPHIALGGLSYQANFNRCVFTNNSTYITCNRGTLKNCLIVGNSWLSSYINVAGTLLGDATVENCTIVSNNFEAGNAWNKGGLVSASAKVYNTIFVGNVGKMMAANWTEVPLYYCLVSHKFLEDKSKTMTGEGNIVLDQGVDEIATTKFVGENDKGLPYYSLQRKSPAVDVGTNLTYTVESVDFAGNPRVVTKGMTLAKNPNAIVDIGCYENQEPPPGLVLILR